MTEEQNLTKAYFVLGLEPGTPMESINRRYRRLVMVWHPDRFPTSEGKNDAEEELKQINIAKDDLTAHFDTSHKETGPCACRMAAADSIKVTSRGAERAAQGPGPGAAKRRNTAETDREEEEALRRDRERARKSADEAAEQQRQKSQTVNATAPAIEKKEVFELSKFVEDEQLRWKIALYIGIAWLGISLFGFIGTSIRAWWHDASFNKSQNVPENVRVSESDLLRKRSLILPRVS